MFPPVSCTIGGMNGKDWKRLGRYIVSRRVELGMNTRQALAEATRLSARMLGDVEKARRTNFDPGALARIENALEWRPGSIDSILAGEEPTPVEPELVQLSHRLRHPVMSVAIKDALTSSDPRLVDLMTRLLQGNLLQPDDRQLAQELLEDRQIDAFPQLFNALSRPGKLSVAQYGSEIYIKELEASHGMADETQPTAPPAGDEDEEDGDSDGPQPVFPLDLPVGPTDGGAGADRADEGQ